MFYILKQKKNMLKLKICKLDFTLRLLLKNDVKSSAVLKIQKM